MSVLGSDRPEQLGDYGGEGERLNKPRQLIDTVKVSILPPGENPTLLKNLRLEKQLSIREIKKLTGHSYSYLQQQLRKFGIDKDKGGFGIAPYGWDFNNKIFVENPAEQAVLSQILLLHRSGMSFQNIASELQGAGVPTKNNGIWSRQLIRKIVARSGENRRGPRTMDPP